MTPSHSLIPSAESQTVEFKTATNAVPKSVYETVCAFSNREGGDIFLGVKDDGSIVGIERKYIGQIGKNFVTAINNENKMYPALYLIPEEMELDGRYILRIHVPKHSQVCRCNGRIYDRNGDADIDITNNQSLVFKLYARKQNSYFVDRVFPRFKLKDLRADLIERARKMTRYRMQNHPWIFMSDEAILRSAGLILRDPNTDEEGITLACILLFGTDNLIFSVLSNHKTDAIFRIANLDRYDDRDVICTNLLDSYDRLMAFGQKHLNDLFVLDGIQNVSARDHILREIISNLLAHRDYSSGFVAKLIIEKDKITTENANMANGSGTINPDTFSPLSKNPAITKVFREIGLADELGSGMRNSYKFSQLYSGKQPIFEEGDVFRITIPLLESATAMAGGRQQTEAFFPEIGVPKADTPKGTPKAPKDTPEDTPKDTPKDSPKGTPKDSPKDSPKDTPKGTPKDSPKEVGIRIRREILQLIETNPQITAKEIAARGISTEYGAQYYIKRLHSDGLIKRIGGKYGGHWEVIDKDV